MTIDISSHLRRLVLAGLPLAAASCLQANAAPPERSSALAAPAPADQPSCAPVTVNWSPGQSGTTVNIGFLRQDPRFSDLFTACTTEGLHCQRLCIEILAAASLSNGGGVASPFNCEVGCDKDGGAVASIVYQISVPGRRPAGFGGEISSAPGATPAAYWAACAAFEGASVAAFAVLAEELQHFGAPHALIARARVAAADELRHFEATAALARGSGARDVAFPRPALPPPRSLAAMALENASEGCVGETFAAALALWQAQAASDPATRAALAAIAADELTHAQLAWDVDAWARGLIDEETGRRLTAARAQAGAALVQGSSAPVEPALVLAAGLPDGAAAARLAAALNASLWA
jgi:hypothetical protein